MLRALLELLRRSSSACATAAQADALLRVALRCRDMCHCHGILPLRAAFDDAAVALAAKSSTAFHAAAARSDGAAACLAAGLGDLAQVYAGRAEPVAAGGAGGRGAGLLLAVAGAACRADASAGGAWDGRAAEALAALRGVGGALDAWAEEEGAEAPWTRWCRATLLVVEAETALRAPGGGAGAAEGLGRAAVRIAKGAISERLACPVSAEGERSVTPWLLLLCRAQRALGEAYRRLGCGRESERCLRSGLKVSSAIFSRGENRPSALDSARLNARRGRAPLSRAILDGLAPPGQAPAPAPRGVQAVEASVALGEVMSACGQHLRGLEHFADALDAAEAFVEGTRGPLPRPLGRGGPEGPNGGRLLESRCAALVGAAAALDGLAPGPGGARTRYALLREAFRLALDFDAAAAAEALYAIAARALRDRCAGTAARDGSAVRRWDGAACFAAARPAEAAQLSPSDLLAEMEGAPSGRRLLRLVRARAAAAAAGGTAAAPVVLSDSDGEGAGDADYAEGDVDGDAAPLPWRILWQMLRCCLLLANGRHPKIAASTVQLMVVLQAVAPDGDEGAAAFPDPWSLAAAVHASIGHVAAKRASLSQPSFFDDHGLCLFDPSDEAARGAAALRLRRLCGALPGAWTVVGACVAPTGHLILSRVPTGEGAAEPATCVAQAGAEDVLSQLDALLEESRSTLKSAAAVPPEGAEGRAEATEDWWRRRFAQDRRMRDLLRDAADGPLQCLCRALRAGSGPGSGSGSGSGSADPAPSVARTLFADDAEAKEDLPAAPAAPAAADAGAERARLSKLRVAELKDALKERGLATVGRKADLVERLLSSRRPPATPRRPLRRGRGRTPRADWSSPSSSPPPAPPATVLVLDAALHRLPLESLPPLLEGAPGAATRVPQLPFALRAHEGALALRRRVARRGGAEGLRGVRAHVVCDHEGNLPDTRARAASLLRKLRRSGCAGFHGSFGPEETGSEAQGEFLLESLGAEDLVLYCGHGAGEALAERTKVAAMDGCAAALLVGCSSGALRDEGEFEPDALCMAYLAAGAPSVAACLWDVTDKDIDGFTYRVLRAMHGADFVKAPTVTFDDREDAPPEPRRGGAGAGVAEAVAKARAGCKLPMLTGAAPVVYGVPTRWY